MSNPITITINAETEAAARQVQQFTSALEQSLGRIVASGDLVSGLGSKIVAAFAVGSLVNFARSAIEAEDAMGKFAERTGVFNVAKLQLDKTYFLKRLELEKELQASRTAAVASSRGIIENNPALNDFEKATQLLPILQQQNVELQRQINLQDKLIAETKDEGKRNQYIAERNGLDPKPTKILNVVNNGDGTDRITVNAVFDLALFSPETVCSWLFYVALASDVEQGELQTEGWTTQKFRVVELPQEYGNFETGVRKIFLFHFWCNPPIDAHWRYTNFASNVVSQNKLFAHFEMEAKQLQRTLRLDESIDIDAKADPNHPFSLFTPVPFNRPLFVEILETTMDDPDTVKKLFAGRVVSVPDSGDYLTGHCESFAWYLKRKIPGPLIGPGCPWQVYDPRTCKVVRMDFETTGTLGGKDNDSRPYTAGLTLNFPDLPGYENWITDNWFAGGLIEVGYGLNYELRVVLNSTFSAGALVVQLNAPLIHAEVGASVQLLPGCNGTMDDCLTKFNNQVNYGGLEHVPADNPSLASIQNPVSQGGKGK